MGADEYFTPPPPRPLVKVDEGWINPCYVTSVRATAEEPGATIEMVDASLFVSWHPDRVAAVVNNETDPGPEEVEG